MNNNEFHIVLGLDRNSKKLNVDDNIFKKKLKKHQLAMLYRVLEIDRNCSYTNNPYAVMSDKPGSGKTYVILSLIYYSITYFENVSRKDMGKNIIVVPQNIFSQWCESMDNFLGSTIKYKTLSAYSEITDLYVNKSILNEFDIILITSLYYDTFAKTIETINLKIRRIFLMRLILYKIC